MNIRPILFSIMAGVAAAGWAAPVEFTVNAFGAPEEGYGFGKAETYDVAIQLKDADLTGKKVTGFKVNTSASSSHLKNVSGWLTSELKLKKGDSGSRVNDPDICSVKATCYNGVIQATFSEPVEIPAEGLYVGYSFTQGTPGKVQPVAVAEGNTAGGFFLHATTSQQKWSDYASRENLVSTMTVMLDGDMAADAATVVLPAKQYLSCEAGVKMPVTIYNHGSEAIRSIDYTFTAGTLTGSGSWTAAEEIPGIFGRGIATTVDLPAALETGESTLTFTVTAVNGKPNQSLSGSAETAAEALDFIAVNRPLVEEFTGLNCGWCPRGYVALEQGKLYHGRQFVALAYHSTRFESGAMTCIDPGDFPIIVQGYPAACVNRSAQIDPGNILSMWDAIAAQPAVCDVDVTLDWADEAHTTLKAVSSVKFLRDVEDSRYIWSVALVADGLSNPRWKQHNSYFDYAAGDDVSGPYWDLFVGKDEYVAGLEFNDVVVWSPNIKGIPDSMPASIKAGEVYEHETLIPVDQIVTLEGKQIVADFNKVRAIAVMLDKFGGIPANSASSLYIGQSGVETVEAAEVIGREYYNLQGLRVERPSKGIFIVVEKKEDGTRAARKVIL